MPHKTLNQHDKQFAVAPMMEWTDRHCRVLHRQFSRRARLYTEMVVAEAILRGDREALLGFSNVEHPVAVQLGGSVPERMAAAAVIAEDFGYDEVNVNIGCPSDRVRTGTFGACLMREPDLVGEIVDAMKQAVRVPVTVKCRTGVDDQDEETALDALARASFAAGADGLWVHARKAWLTGLSPKDNRTVPPLSYDRVYRLKETWPEHFVGINGGIGNLTEAERYLTRVDGVMMGRAAYHDPGLLAAVDQRLFSDDRPVLHAAAIVAAYRPYLERMLAKGVRLHHLTRHMLGLFHGQPGARKWRQMLSERSNAPDAGFEVVELALNAVVATGMATRREQPTVPSEAALSTAAADHA
ncbi:MAG: tRNA dihydrouridine(20/20a) synthase DusA [Alphaproteobacteria bacterium]